MNGRLRTKDNANAESNGGLPDRPSARAVSSINGKIAMCPSIVASWFDYPVSSTAVGVF
jgi:hypothetical protein